MNTQIANQNRHITVIVDPHIKDDSEYYVFEDGIEIEDEPQPDTNYTNIFIRKANKNVFVAVCWPGESAWIDFLNENA